MTPQAYIAEQIAALHASQQFTGDMMSCRTPGDGGGAIIREGQCIWAKGRERLLDVDGGTDHLGLEDRTTSFSAGGQIALADAWRGGLALGYDGTDTRSGNGRADGERFNAGAVLKYTAGQLQLAGAISGGWGQADVTRSVAFPGFSGTVTGDSDVTSYTAMLRAAYVFDVDNAWYAKPFADLSYTRLDFSGVTEAGGLPALTIAGGETEVVTISPALEIGANLPADWIAAGAWLRPFVRAGFSWRDEDEFAVTSSLLAAPQGFTTTMGLDDLTADVAAGFDLVTDGASALRVEYSGRYSDDVSESSFAVKGSLPF